MTKQALAATNLERGEKMKDTIYVIVIIIGATLGYAIGNGSSVQSHDHESICSCDENCQCCAACPCSHGEH